MSSRAGDPPHRHRRCVGCHRSGPKEGLWRVVFVPDEGEYRWDREHRMHGRGMYVHPAFACVRAIGDGARLEREVRRARASNTIKCSSKAARGDLGGERRGLRRLIEEMYQELQRDTGAGS